MHLTAQGNTVAMFYRQTPKTYLHSSTYAGEAVTICIRAKFPRGFWNSMKLSINDTQCMSLPITSGRIFSFHLLVISWWLEVRVEGHHLRDEVMPLLLQLLASSELTGVQALPLAIVNGLGGRGPAENTHGYASRSQTQGATYKYRFP